MLQSPTDRGVEMAAKKTKDLTVTACDAKSIPGKYGDRDGLMLIVRASGSKSWGQKVTIKGGKRAELGLGSYPAISLGQAREIAASNRAQAKQGIDPRDTVQAARAAQVTFSEFAEQVWNDKKAGYGNAKHTAQWISTLKTYANPFIGNKPVAEVSRLDIQEVLKPIWIEKPETARRVLQRLGVVFGVAVAHEVRPTNPTTEMKHLLPKQGDKKKHLKALPYAEVSEFLETLSASGALPSTKLCFEFLILTAVRSGEARLAEWPEIDFESALWTIPAERMKARAEHRVPLSERVVEILHGAKKLAGDSHLIFNGLRRGHALSDMTLSKLVKELGFDAVPHGFRTSFRMWVQDRTSYSEAAGEAALAHKVGNVVAQAYARSDYLDDRRAMMQRWSDFLVNDGEKVVELHKRDFKTL